MAMQNLGFRDLSPTMFAKTTGDAFLRAITWPTSPFQDAGRLCWLSGKITITLLSVWPISPPDRRESPFRPTAEAGMVMPPRPQLFPPHVSHVLDIWRFLCPRVLPQARGQPLLSDTWCHSSAWFVSQIWQCKICQMRRGNGNGSPWLGLNKVHFVGNFTKMSQLETFSATSSLTWWSQSPLFAFQCVRSWIMPPVSLSGKMTVH